jgi:membrane protein YqaA with SNARE-associated domain
LLSPINRFAPLVGDSVAKIPGAIEQGDEPSGHIGNWRSKLVRAVGVEPTLCHQNRILSPARLPIPPRPQGRRRPSGRDMAAPASRRDGWGLYGEAMARQHRDGSDGRQDRSARLRLRAGRIVSTEASNRGDRMLRGLYDWTMSLAATRHAERALAGVSFIESSFFPIPPDVLLIPMVLAEPRRWLRYAAVCTIASVLGALLGYAIGAFLFELIGRPILELYNANESFEKLSEWYNVWGGWGVLFAAITPFPYKVVTIFSGATGLNLVVFIAVSLLGRAARFFLVAWLLYRFGPPIRLFIERNLGLLFTLFMVLLIGGFVAVRYLF